MIMEFDELSILMLKCRKEFRNLDKKILKYVQSRDQNESKNGDFVRLGSTELPIDSI